MHHPAVHGARTCCRSVRPAPPPHLTRSLAAPAALPPCARARPSLPAPRSRSIDVVAAAFEGKSAVDRQRMVYKAIWMELQEAVHAVDAMSTRTPAEAGR
jgi:hypothetical protein